ncbi:dihydrofolate reductase (plasmid) [Paraburkholderia sp. PREW-6R]|uniref:dihydrofolate reductase n=1 Tax=Paraburkholderia sp. PREW-6R TaxID=3141544 RepID=UPI0031F4CE29
MVRNQAIGGANDDPWRASGEQQRPRQPTGRHSVVTGRRTYESMGRPLLNRDIQVPGQKLINAEPVATCATLQGKLS